MRKVRITAAALAPVPAEEAEEKKMNFHTTCEQKRNENNERIVKIKKALENQTIGFA